MQRAKAVEGAVGTTTVANMMKRDHMRVFFRRTAALAAFVALLWAVQVVNWIVGYGLNPERSRSAALAPVAGYRQNLFRNWYFDIFTSSYLSGSMCWRSAAEAT